MGQHIDRRITPDCNVVLDVCKLGELSPECQEVMEEVYLNTISDSREVKTLYDTALNAAVGSQKSKGDWNPDRRSLSEYDRKLLIGPQSMAKFFVKISVTDSVTNRQIAYSSYL